MNEKQFTLSDSDLRAINNTVAIADDGIPCTQRHICKLLNELNDVQRELRKELELTKKELSE